MLDRLIAYRSAIGRPADSAFRRLLARAWNGNVGKIEGWPALKLMVPPTKATLEIAWESFPEGLRSDIELYLQGLTRVRRSRTGNRIKPLQPSTLITRRRELPAAARMAVKAGVPIAQLTSLAALLTPAVSELVLDAYWKQNGEQPKLFTIELANRFLSIARETRCLGEAECESLEELRRKLEDYRDEGLTEKNFAFLRQVLTADVWGRVFKLPYTMMAEAERLRNGVCGCDGHGGYSQWRQMRWLSMMVSSSTG